MREKRSYSKRSAALQMIVIAPMIVAVSWWIRVELESLLPYPIPFLVSTLPIILFMLIVRPGYNKLLMDIQPHSSWIIIGEGFGSILFGMFFFSSLFLGPVSEFLSNPRLLLWMIFGIAWVFTGILEILVGFVVRYENRETKTVISE